MSLTALKPSYFLHGKQLSSGEHLGDLVIASQHVVDVDLNFVLQENLSIHSLINHSAALFFFFKKKILPLP